MQQIFVIAALIAALCLSGCATLDPSYEKPKVDVVGITKSQGDTAALQFTLKLRIVNPNAEPIEIDGIYYELSLDGIDVINGTARDIPTIEGFSDEIVSLSAAPSLINSMRLASRLMEFSGSEIPYELKAKLGTTSKWMPSTTITENGTIPIR